jgi:hypothetical protein
MRAATLGDAQRDFDRWCVGVADRRKCPGGTVGQVGAAEPLRSLPPAAYPAADHGRAQGVTLGADRVRGQPLQRPACCVGRAVTVLASVGDPLLRIVSGAGEVVAEHRRAPCRLRPDHPRGRARRAARAGRAGGVHDREGMPAQGQRAAR